MIRRYRKGFLRSLSKRSDDQLERCIDRFAAGSAAETKTSERVKDWVTRLIARTNAWEKWSCWNDSECGGIAVLELINAELGWMADACAERSPKTIAAAENADEKPCAEPFSPEELAEFDRSLMEKLAHNDFQTKGQTKWMQSSSSEFAEAGVWFFDVCDQLGIARSRPLALDIALNRLAHPETTATDLETALSDLPGALGENLLRVAKTFSLTPDEAETLAFLFCIKRSEKLTVILESFNFAKGGIKLLAQIMSAAFGREVPESVLSASGSLSKRGLIETGHLDDSNPCRWFEFFAGSHVAAQMFVMPLDVEEIFCDSISSAAAAKLKLESFSHVPAVERILIPYLEEVLEAEETGVNVLLYGRPGTGKTELTKLVAKELGAKLYEVSSDNDKDSGSSRCTRLSRWTCAETLFASAKRTLLLVDEADDVFNDGLVAGDKKAARLNKAELVSTLESARVPTFWVTNSIHTLDEALVRRFDVVLELPIPPAKVRRQVAENAFGGVVSDDFLERCAAAEDLSPGVAARAGRVVRRLADAAQNQADAKRGQSAEESAAQLINATLAAQGRRQLPERISLVSSIYSTEFVNTEVNLDAVADGIERTGSARLCLYGPPGTGKTAYVRWLAQRLGRPLLVKRASDILSMWVGGTEENLAQAFKEARQEGAVLLIDEADSFLRDRAANEHSWETSQVNELLTQMESFDGIFCATTNLFESIDRAALRRFDLKAAFKPLRPEQAKKLALRYAEKLGAAANESDFECLLAISDLTPGDFEAVARGARFNPIADGRDFARRLKEECDVKHYGRTKAKIGF